jgi:hypothetical protein
MEAHGLDRSGVPVRALAAQYIFDLERKGLEDDPHVALAALAKCGLWLQASQTRRGRLGWDWLPTAFSTPFRWACIEYKLTGETLYTDGNTPTDYLYTGQRKEEVGLYFFNARRLR